MQKYIPLFIILLFLAGCRPAPVVFTNPAWPTPTPPTGEPRRFLTPTPTLPPPAAPRPSPVFTHTPLPSPTPFMHTVRSDETMLGIALRYGVELAALKAANPEVDPYRMSVGTLLVIPLEGATVPSDPTPTPAPLSLGTPTCYPAADGSLWCGLVLHNTTAVPVENISVLLDLVGPDGALLASQVLFPPLNRLPSGEKIGLGGRFPGLDGIRIQPYASLLTASPVGEEDQRYLPARLAEEQLSFSNDRRQVHFSGVVEIEGAPRILWVAAQAFDAAGSLVGLRKLVFDVTCPQADPQTPVPCPPVVYDGILYSAGPQIASLQVLVEARP